MFESIPFEKGEIHLLLVSLLMVPNSQYLDLNIPQEKFEDVEARMLLLIQDVAE